MNNRAPASTVPISHISHHAPPDVRFRIALQRRGGLAISMAKEAATILGRHDQPVDPTLDMESNAEEHSARHNHVLRKWEDAVRAVAVGVVRRGDKLPPEVALGSNGGTIFDLSV